jgi:uncharacterized protein (TIGR02646 family)
MIHVNRKRVPQPPALRSSAVKVAYRKLQKFFDQPASKRSQKRPFDLTPLFRAKPILLQLTHNKCAYCEQRLDTGFDIENFRPKALEREPEATDHYWWLVYDWNNLLPSCTTCNRAKRNLFPIAGKRCAPGAIGDALLKENPLLIDPCEHAPERFFEFTRTGNIWPARWLTPKEKERAMTTIDLLQLDRPSLVMPRHAAIQQVDRAIHALLNKTPRAERLRSWNMLLMALIGRRPFTAACRWAFFRHLPALHKHVGKGTEQAYLTKCMAFAKPYLEAAGRAGDQPITRLKALRHIPPARKRSGIARTLTVREVVVENFRIIRRARFTIPEGRPGDLGTAAEAFRLADPAAMAADQVKRSCGWKMLLGENGSGKSSILQAITIALMGEDYYRSVESQFADSLRHGARSGRIQVFFHQSVEPVEVKVGKRGLTWVSGATGPNVFLRAYGATRLLPKIDPKVDYEQVPVQPQKHADNLFDPFVPLVNATDWLRGLERTDFNQACISLKDLLAIEAEMGELGFQNQPRTGRATGPFGLRTGKTFVPLHYFSAGYQTIVALACDIMAGTGATMLSDMRSVPGIVIIDEIGTNLHPRWRMRILRSLERTFSNMQLIASTHEPLCLHGLGAEEVAVVERTEDEVHLNNDLPSPAGMRTDQLLTSEFFGLNTTLDPATEEKFAVYYDLLARKADLKLSEQKQLQRLGDELNSKSVLGNSRRDQFILRTVDEYLASEKALKNSAAKAKASEKARRTIENALSRVGYTIPA